MKKHFLFFILIVISFSVKAHDFYSVNDYGDTIYYNITSSTAPYTASVTYKGSSDLEYLDEYMDTIHIPSTVTHDSITYTISAIDGFAFSVCFNLKSVILTDSIIKIGGKAFADCINLLYFTIPNNVNNISVYAFYNCRSLKSITIPSSVSFIGECAFHRCDSLLSINVDNNNLNYASFNGMLHNKTLDTLICCPGGTSGIVNIPDFVTTIVRVAFEGCNYITKVNIPHSVTSIDRNVFQLSNRLDTIIVDNNNPNYSSHNGILYNKNMDTLLYFPTARGGDVIIPDFVNVIGSYAFILCKRIKALYISNSVVSIEHKAFDRCDSVQFIYIGNSVREIGFLNFLLSPIPFIDSIQLKLIICMALTPPDLDNYAFGFTPRDIPIYVPCRSVELYQSAPTWNTFTNYASDYEVNIFDTICEGETYNKNGFNESIEGVYHNYYRRINDCDSTINLHLTVKPLPSNLSYEIVNNDLLLSWHGNNPSYTIYRNNDSIATISDTIYIDRNLIDGTNYCYKVKSISGGCESEDLCLNYIGLNIIEESNVDAILYPNPTSDKTTLELKGLKNKAIVTIYNILGEAVRTYELNNNQQPLEIELNHYTPGIYNIKILIEDNIIVKKLIVK